MHIVETVVVCACSSFDDASLFTSLHENTPTLTGKNTKSTTPRPKHRVSVVVQISHEVSIEAKHSASEKLDVALAADSCNSGLQPHARRARMNLEAWIYNAT